MAKTAILRGTEPFHVFESLLLEDGEYFLAERHFRRLERACNFFRIHSGTERLKAGWLCALESVRADRRDGRFKARIAFDGTAFAPVDCTPAGLLPSPYTVSIAASRVDPDDPFVRHKTNRRRHVDEALARSRGTSDVILVNTRGELTETSRGNLVLSLGGRLVTPPEASGLLPGVYREKLLETGELEEHILYPEDIARADKIIMINSVRKRVECVMA